MELPDETELMITEPGGVILRKRTQPQVGAVYVTCGSAIKSTQDVQQGTLTGARFAHDRQHLTFRYLER